MNSRRRSRNTKAGAAREDAPVFSWNLGQCYRKLGRYQDAIWNYERFLERGKPTGDVESSTRKFIVQMTAEREKAVMKQPLLEPARPPTPRSASLGQLLPARLPPAERDRGMPLKRKLAVGMGVTGAAVVGVGVVLGLRAESLERDADAICPMRICDRADEATTLIGRGKTSALYANLSFGVGGAALVGAAALWLIGGPRVHKDRVITPLLSRSFTGVTASMKF